MMKTLIGKMICFIGRRLLSLRYKVEFRGLDALKRERLYKKGGTLFLPNHPAIIDPLIIYMYFWPKFRMRPIVIDYMYRQPFVHSLMKLIRALPIPNFETSINELKLKQAESSIQETGKGLEEKNAFLIYPAGRLKDTGKEILGGASAAHNLLSRFPDTNIVLIRTTGLWGSSFSRALEHKTPHLGKAFANGFKVLLKNGIFFCRRRKVIVEFTSNPKNFPIDGSRLDMNRFLEQWYNRYPVGSQVVDKEPLTFISYAFYKKIYPKIQKKIEKKKAEISGEISQEAKDKILAEIAKHAKISLEKLEPEMNLALDLGLDSLDIAALAVYLSDHFDLDEVYPEDLETVQDVLDMPQREKRSKKKIHEEISSSWPEEKDRPDIGIPEEKTIMEAFFGVCKRMGDAAAVGDDISGVLSYKKMQKAVIALALAFQKYPEKHVGVLLPSSAAAFIVILALMTAGKVPVMMNWTLGKKFLNDTLKQTDTKVVISSWKFLEKLSYVEFGDMVHQIRFLEDIRKNISVKTKMQTLITSFKPVSSILKKFQIQNVSAHDQAVILFTSGTESVPKGVPLTHENILLDQKGSMAKVPFDKEDVFYAVLPPFHSFGLSVAGLFPILAGLKIAFYPDPTDSCALAKGIEKWKATIFAAPPTFLKALLTVAEKKQLETMRLFICGAEKTPDSLFGKVKEMHEKAFLIQGYGITECSPAVAMNEVGKPIIGVGKPISFIECRTVHPETKKPLAIGMEGEICLSGPTVFSGYLDPSIDPFIYFEEKKWYLTGDIGRCDAEGNIILSGRLKRFAKIGGEMISIGAVEEAIVKELAQDTDTPSIAVSYVEGEESSFLVLFTTIEVDKARVNALLKEKGFSRLIKISFIHKMAALPITGSGKIDYRNLQSLGLLHG